MVQKTEINGIENRKKSLRKTIKIVRNRIQNMEYACKNRTFKAYFRFKGVNNDWDFYYNKEIESFSQTQIVQSLCRITQIFQTMYYGRSNNISFKKNQRFLTSDCKLDVGIRKLIL